MHSRTRVVVVLRVHEVARGGEFVVAPAPGSASHHSPRWPSSASTNVSRSTPACSRTLVTRSREKRSGVTSWSANTPRWCSMAWSNETEPCWMTASRWRYWAFPEASGRRARHRSPRSRTRARRARDGSRAGSTLAGGFAESNRPRSPRSRPPTGSRQHRLAQELVAVHEVTGEFRRGRDDTVGDVRVPVVVDTATAGLPARHVDASRSQYAQSTLSAACRYPRERQLGAHW